MSALAQGGVMLVAGVIVFRTVLVGGHVNYVRPGLRIPLLLGAGMIVVIGVASLWSKASRDEPRDGHGHATSTRRETRVGWLVLAPMLALITIPQVPLGAFAARLGGDRAPAPRAALDFPPLPAPRDGAIDLPLSGFVGRALYAPESLEGATVRLVGFVTPDPEAPSGWLLTRFTIGCCAADALPMKVAVLNEPPRPPDQWLEVLGVFRRADPGAAGKHSPPKLAVVESRPIPPPETPYEY